MGVPAPDGAALGPGVELVASDAGDAAAVAALARQVASRHGAVDVLFLNAGITRYGLITQLAEADFDETMRINVKGPWLALKHFAPLLRRGASVVWDRPRAVVACRSAPEASGK